MGLFGKLFKTYEGHEWTMFSLGAALGCLGFNVLFSVLQYIDGSTNLSPGIERAYHVTGTLVALAFIIRCIDLGVEGYHEGVEEGRKAGEE